MFALALSLLPHLPTSHRPERLVTFKRTAVSFVLSLLLPSAVLLAAPVSAQTKQQPATEHHVPSPTTTRRVHRTPVRTKIVRRPAHRITPHHTAPEPSDHHPLN